MSSRNREIPIGTREIIVKLKNEGKSLREIGAIVNKPRSSVQRVIENFKSSKKITSKPRGGRPRKLSQRDERDILRIIKQNPKTNASKISQGIKELKNIAVTPQTVRNVLHRHDLRSRVSRRKPLISEKNRKLRLEFAKNYLDKDTHFWDSVIFTDESKFNIFGSDGRQKVWREPNTAMQLKNLTPTVKHGGGNVMVWGCMAASGAGNLHFIDVRMDRFVYLELLKENLEESAKKLGLESMYTFQQDNDPKHTAKIVQEWIGNNTPAQLKTPPQSPDLNVIEHLWEHLERKIRQHDINSAGKLKTALMEEWSKIPQEITKNLVASMKKRLLAVIAANGCPTKY